MGHSGGHCRPLHEDIEFKYWSVKRGIKKRRFGSYFRPGAVALNPSTQGAEAGRTPVQGQTGLQREIQDNQGDKESLCLKTNKQTKKQTENFLRVQEGLKKLISTLPQLYPLGMQSFSIIRSQLFFLAQTLSHRKHGRSQEAEAEGLCVWSQAGLHSESQTLLRD